MIRTLFKFRTWVSCLILCMVMMGVSGVVSAQTTSDEQIPSDPTALPLPSLYIGDIKLDKVDYSQGDTVKGSFVVTNSGDVDANNFNYQVALIGGLQENGVGGFVYDTKRDSEVLVLKAGESKTVNFTYALPVFPKDSAPGINVRALFHDGISLAWNSIPIKLKNGVPILKLVTANVELNNQKYDLQEGPTLKPGEKAVLNATFYNDSTESYSLTPRLALVDKSFIPLQNTPSLDGQTFKVEPRSTSSVSLELPVGNLAAGTYLGKVSFDDVKGVSHAPLVYARYIIGGDIVSVQSVFTDTQVPLTAGKSIKVVVTSTGKPLDITTAPTANTPVVADLHIVLSNEKDEIVGEETIKDSKFNTSNAIPLEIKINSDANILKAKVELVQKNTIISSFDGVVTFNPNYISKVSAGENWVSKLLANKAVLIVVSLILLIVLLILFVKFKKKKIATLMLILFTVLVGVSQTLAYIATRTGYVSITGGPSKSTLYPGENFNLNVTMSMGTCNNASQWYFGSASFNGVRRDFNHLQHDDGKGHGWYPWPWHDEVFSFTAPDTEKAYRASISATSRIIVDGQGISDYTVEGYWPISVIGRPGACGYSDGIGKVSRKPTEKTALCKEGDASLMTKTDVGWSWKCQNPLGILAECQTSCYYKEWVPDAAGATCVWKPSVCGSANDTGALVYSKPTTGIALCRIGTPSNMTVVNGEWKWDCKTPSQTPPQTANGSAPLCRQGVASFSSNDLTKYRCETARGGTPENCSAKCKDPSMEAVGDACVPRAGQCALVQPSDTRPAETPRLEALDPNRSGLVITNNGVQLCTKGQAVFFTQDDGKWHWKCSVGSIPALSDVRCETTCKTPGWTVQGDRCVPPNVPDQGRCGAGMYSCVAPSTVTGRTIDTTRTTFLWECLGISSNTIVTPLGNIAQPATLGPNPQEMVGPIANGTVRPLLTARNPLSVSCSYACPADQRINAQNVCACPATGQRINAQNVCACSVGQHLNGAGTQCVCADEAAPVNGRCSVCGDRSVPINGQCAGEYSILPPCSNGVSRINGNCPVAPNCLDGDQPVNGVCGLEEPLVPALCLSGIPPEDGLCDGILFKCDDQSLPINGFCNGIEPITTKYVDVQDLPPYADLWESKYPLSEKTFESVLVFPKTGNDQVDKRQIQVGWYVNKSATPCSLTGTGSWAKFATSSVSVRNAQVRFEESTTTSSLTLTCHPSGSAEIIKTVKAVFTSGSEI